MWDEKFDTDEAALEEIMKVIVTEGIETFSSIKTSPRYTEPTSAKCGWDK